VVKCFVDLTLFYTGYFYSLFYMRKGLFVPHVTFQGELVEQKYLVSVVGMTQNFFRHKLG